MHALEKCILPRVQCLSLEVCVCVGNWNINVNFSIFSYCNRLLYGTSQHNFDRLQRVLNSLAHVVIQAPRRSSATELRRQLHWLPICQCVNFKLGIITFRAIHPGTSTYLVCELHQPQPRSGTTTSHYTVPASCVFGLLPTLLCSLCTGNLEQYTCFHPRFWHLGHLQNCSETHLFNSVYMPCHWQPSICTSDSLFRDIWRQLNKSILSDWWLYAIWSALLLLLFIIKLYTKYKYDKP